MILLTTITSVALLAWSTKKGTSKATKRTLNIIASALLVLTLCFTFGGSAHHRSSKASSSETTAKQNWLGKKINKSAFESHNDGKITAAKIYVVESPINGMMVQNDLASILDDPHLKYTNEKEATDQFLLKDETNTINVYSAKNQQWFHFHGQTNDDGKYSTVSIWPGKDSDGI